jgi:hypothetical protein
LRGVVARGPGTQANNHVESVQDSSGLRFFKQLAATSKAKTVFPVMETLFHNSYDESKRNTWTEQGLRVSFRSPHTLEKRKIDAQNRKEEKSVANTKSLTVAVAPSGLAGAPSSAPAVRGKKLKAEGRKWCMCRIGNCDNGNCSCFKKFGGDEGVVTCSIECTCRCADKRTQADPAPPVLPTKVSKVKQTVTAAALEPVPAAVLAPVAPLPAPPALPVLVQPVSHEVPALLEAGAVAGTAQSPSVSDDGLELNDPWEWIFGKRDWVDWNDLPDNQLPSTVNETAESVKKRDSALIDLTATCPVCQEDRFEQNGPRQAIQCTLSTPTKPCCSQTYHLVHAFPVPKLGSPWQCASCQNGGATGKRKKTTREDK